MSPRKCFRARQHIELVGVPFHAQFQRKVRTAAFPLEIRRNSASESSLKNSCASEHYTAAKSFACDTKNIFRRIVYATEPSSCPACMV